jgi:hypothetical protein
MKKSCAGDAGAALKNQKNEGRPRCEAWTAFARSVGRFAYAQR